MALEELPRQRGGADVVGRLARHRGEAPGGGVGLGHGVVGGGLVERVPDATDSRVVRVRLTTDGARRLATLAAAHHEELARLAPRLRPLWDGLEPS